MPLVGTRLGPYELVTLLGHGGMGEVYRARDTRLDRSVAIKVIAPGLTPDPDARRRLVAEARAASLLNHPNICALYDIGTQDTTDFLVMELLEGETLGARLQRGALPFASVVRIGLEIAQALDAAHAHGIVHRDLKPGNVMLTKSGAKLLDFGIATIGRSVGDHDAAASTTGTVTGTPPYMAPEQLEGGDVDSRADVFALGAVLYEMATGSRAVTTAASAPGPEREPIPPSRMRAGIPIAFDRLVLRCLAKDPEDRWQSVRDIGFQLRAIGEPDSTRTVVRSRPRWIAVAAVAGVALLTLAAAAALRRPAPITSGTFQIALPPGSRLEPPEAVSSLALTPDGSQIAFVATYEGRNRLWIRPLNSATARPIPGTEDARIPFWSPDGRSLGFFAAGRLLRVDPAAGPPQLICEASVDTAPTWGADDTILFAQTPDAARGRSGGVYRVPASGGAITQVTTVDRSRGESEHYWPSFLPDGVHFFYVATIAEEDGIGRRHTVFLGSTSDTAVKKIADIESRVSYSPTGHLLYGQNGSLIARAFDLRGRFTGDPVSIAERLWYYKPTGMAQYAVSDTGVVAYQGGPSVSELVWLDRSGRQIGTLSELGSYADVRISPSGREVAVVAADSQTGSSDIWIFDRESGIPNRFTAEAGGASRPVFSADGTLLFFRLAGTNGPPDIYQKRADGRGAHEVRLALDGIQQPMDASPDGRYLVYNDANRATIRDIWLLPLSPAGPPRPFLQTIAVEQDARISPDSRWMAFMSSESGRAEVYVAPLDDPNAKRRVSADGGLAPRWRRDGRELVYIDLADTVMALDFSGGPAMKRGTPHPLFSAGRLVRNPGAGFGEPYYDFGPDGESFLVNRVVRDPAVEPITVVLNWPSLLKK